MSDPMDEPTLGEMLRKNGLWEKTELSDLAFSSFRLLDELRFHRLSLATAESCTGGNIAHQLTLIPGASDVFLGGVVSYCNEAKQRVLGVKAETLAANGAVSEAVVGEMARGAARVFGADCAVATSGIAGPGGAVPGKPVGTVWFAVLTPRGLSTRLLHLSGSRDEVITAATSAAIAALLGALSTT